VAQRTAPQWRGAAQAEGRPIGLKVETAGDTAIMGWPAGLREALTNLIFNAVDALPQGGTIRLTARRRGEQVAVEVADSGVGMSPEVQARIFEPFFTTKGERGTGLGLSQVFGIVERHAGTIHVVSAVGRGTTIQLTFPAAPAPEPVSPGSAGAQAASRPLRVLAVDDEPAITSLVAQILGSAGHIVAKASSGEEALKRLAMEPFDLVVSDVGMGAGMNGWELADRVRQSWPRVRFVLATGWGAQIRPEEARARGVEAVIAKPYRLADLQRLVAAQPPTAGESPVASRQSLVGTRSS
jgi:CheY-like chemotaxis protein